jgi:mersacidin/lichenicidin family type 2 lantibiotic
MAVDIVRAWKDPEYRKTLTPEELASLPENPAGKVELTGKDLDSVAGGVVIAPVGSISATCAKKPT